MEKDRDQEHEVWTRVIEVYKDRPHMWDKKHKHYFNRDMRQQTFEMMFEIFSELESDVNMSQFKKKFENMRTSFRINVSFFSINGVTMQRISSKHSISIRKKFLTSLTSNSCITFM